MNNDLMASKRDPVTIGELVKELRFEILNEGNFQRIVDVSSIYQIGYELIGFFDYNKEELKRTIHVCGKKEFMYLETLNTNDRKVILEKYFSFKFPALVLTKDSTVPKDMLEIAQKNKVTLLRSNLGTPGTIRELKFFLLNRLVSATILKDHMFLEIFGIGVLITGYEDAKIGVAVELLERGHRLITDNNVIVKRLAENDLEGCNRFDKSVTDSHFFIFNKKDGNVIDVTSQFGIKATRRTKKIDILIVLEEWNEKKFYDRLGLDTVYEEILGEKIPKIVLPVRKGRNLAVILETAAVNTRLKMMGESSAEYFVKESQKIIEENKKNQGEDEMEKGLAVRVLKNEFGLKVIFGEDKLDDTFVKSTTIHRPALALSGFCEMYSDKKNVCVQIFSNDEFKYLNSLDETTRKANLDKYLSFNFPLLVLTADAKVPDYFLTMVKEKGHILCRSSYKKSSQLVAMFNSYLETYFAPTVSLHGVFLELYGFGVLLTGKSGIGKSETALELIHRGHRLVADDFVKFAKDTRGTIIGKAARLPYFMEIRGLGIIDIKSLYGLGAVRITKRLDLVIEMKEQEQDDYLTSVVYENSTFEILSKKVPKIGLYISSGRNAAAMVEIAVMNMMAKILGHDAEKSYEEGIKNITEEEKKFIGR